MISKRFTRLTVLKEIDSPIQQRRYLCRCDCGTETSVYRANLLQGRSQSCGCLKRETTSRIFKTHGMSSTAEYRIWAGIKKRCYTTTYREYHLYGGRGIRMSRAWKNSFEAFRNDMGARPSPAHSIERKNNNAGYNKDNCTWALARQQTYNRRIGHFVTYQGKRMHLKEFSESLNASYFSIYAWVVRRGMTADQAAQKALSLQSAP